MGRLLVYTLVSLLSGALSSIMTLAVTGTLGSAGAGWIQAISSIAAVIVSLVAVILVRQTLDATKKAVEVTEEIGEQQLKEARATLKSTRQIGDAQIRPWLAVENCTVNAFPRQYGSVHKYAPYFEVRLKLCNHGHTPAEFVFLKSNFHIELVSGGKVTRSFDWDSRLHRNNTMNIKRIAQGGTHTVENIDIPVIDAELYQVTWIGSIGYKRAYGTETDMGALKEDFTILIKKQGGADFETEILPYTLISTVADGR